LFYEYQDEYSAKILIEKQLISVSLKRLKLAVPASELYPQGYDLEQLFVEYHERKFNRDIDRGSKKAQKQLRRQAEQRQKH
jgi:hypothetical protein